MQLVQMGTELATANSMVNLERQKVAIKDKKIEAFETKIESHETKIEELTRKLRDRENQLKETQKELSQTKYLLNQKELDQEKQKKKFDNKRAVDNEKITREYEYKLRAEKDRMHVSINNIIEKFNAHELICMSIYFRISYVGMKRSFSSSIILSIMRMWIILRYTIEKKVSPN